MPDASEEYRRSAGGEERAARAPLLELFASIQGEGAHAGRPQVFLRLAGCPLRCAWCDTPGSWRLSERPARVEGPDGEREEASWIDAARAARWIEALDPSGLRAVSLTGGEPLMWPDFLLALRAALPARRLHLETAGAHPHSLRRVLGACDHVSLDLKLPADMAAPEELRPAPDHSAGPFEASPSDADSWRSARRAVLGLVAAHDACAKLIVAGGRTGADFEPLLLDLAELAPRIPLIVQPATPVRGVGAPAQALVAGLVERALALGLDVRMLPQVHALLGLR